MKKYHITFANKYYLGPASFLKKTAIQFGLNTIVFTPKDFDSRFKAINNKILKFSRGHGYWVWKPWIIYKQLEAIDWGDIVLYTDAACFFVADPSPLFDLTKNQDVVVFELTNHPERVWTKPEVLDYLNVKKDDCISPQRMSSFIVIKKTKQSMQFIKEWIDLSTPKLLNDETKSRDRFFHAHRHDQSILSLISKLYKFAAYRDPSQFGCEFKNQYNNSPYGQILQHTRKSNLTLIRRFNKSIKPKLIYLYRFLFGK